MTMLLAWLILQSIPTPQPAVTISGVEIALMVGLATVLLNGAGLLIGYGKFNGVVTAKQDGTVQAINSLKTDMQNNADTLKADLQSELKVMKEDSRRNIEELKADMGRRVEEIKSSNTQLWKKVDEHTDALGYIRGQISMVIPKQSAEAARSASAGGS